MSSEGTLGRWEAAAAHAGGFLVFLMMYTPRANVEVKAPFLVLALLGGAASLLTGRAKVSAALLAWFWLYVTYGAIWSAIGYLNGNPGVEDYFRLNVVWPILYLPLVLAVHRVEVLEILLKYLLAALVAVSLFNILLFLVEVGYLPSNPIVEVEMGARIGVHEGYVQLTSHNIGSLMFLVPLFVTFILIGSNDLAQARTVRLAFAILVGLVAVLLSGRRALWLLVLVTPAVAVVCSKLLPRVAGAALRRRAGRLYLALTAGLLAVAALLLNTTDWDPRQFIERATGFLTDDEGIRGQQAQAFLLHLMDSPLVGSGFGLGIPELVRDEEHPWANYELYYLHLLYNIGLVGALIYSALLLFVASRLVVAARRSFDIAFPALVAYLMFLVASATNPYLGSFDFMFVIFFGLAVANCLNERRLVPLATRLAQE